MAFSDGELSFENGSLYDKQKESTSEGDDDTLIYYQESNEYVGTRNSAADSTKRQSKTDSDYVRVYNDIHNYDRNQKVTNIHSVQEEEAPNAIATKNAKTTDEEAGMIHVAAVENKQYTAGLSNEKDGGTLA